MEVPRCLLLTQSGHGRLKIAAVQTNSEPQLLGMSASKARSLPLPKYRGSPILQFSGELYAYLHTNSKIFSGCCGCGRCGDFFDRGARRGFTSDRGGAKSLMLHRMPPESGSLRAYHMPLHLWGNCAGRRLSPCNHGMAFAALPNGVRAVSRAAVSAILIPSTNAWTRTACT